MDRGAAVLSGARARVQRIADGRKPTKTGAGTEARAPVSVRAPEFASVDAAKAWYVSDDYQDALRVRQANSVGKALIVDGYTPPAS